MATDSFDLMGLPIELICHISSYISTKDLTNLRLSCRAVERILFDPFATEFFSTRQTFQHPISLQNLVDISKHPQFSKAVRKVIFCDDRLQVHNITSATAQNFYLDQKHCIESGETRRLLAIALQGLPNCHTLEQRDFISPRQRCRDGTAWRSYGVKFIEQSCADDLHCRPHMSNMLQQNIAFCLLGAVVDASAQGFRIENLHCINQGPDWDLNSFYVPPYLAPTYSSTFVSLKSLMLSLSHSGTESDARLHHFTKFLDMLPELEHLRVNLNDRHHNTQWLQDTLIECISKKPVRNLELGKMSIGLKFFKRLLQGQAKILEKLTFFHVALCPSSDAGDGTPLRMATTMWHAAITPLQDMPALRSVTFNCIYDPSPKVVFIKDCNGLYQRTLTIAEDSRDKMIEKLETLDGNLFKTREEVTRYDQDDSNEDDSDDEESDLTNEFDEFEIMQGLMEVDQDDDEGITGYEHGVTYTIGDHELL